MSTSGVESCDKVDDSCVDVNSSEGPVCEAPSKAEDVKDSPAETPSAPEKENTQENQPEMPKKTTNQGDAQKDANKPDQQSGKDDPVQLQRLVDELKKSLKQTQLKLIERDRLALNQEKQIVAFTTQVSSLKEVIALTKNMLEIRNMEVKHLQEDISSLETKISAERTRHDAMLTKMDAAVRLNATLKNEYETQLHLFQDLRGKYEEKIDLLMADKNTSHAL